MSFSVKKSIFKIIFLPCVLLASGQINAADTGTKHADHASKPKKHSHHHSNKSSTHPKKTKEEKLEDCKKLLETPAPEKPTKSQNKKRKRCERMLSKHKTTAKKDEAVAGSHDSSKPAATEHHEEAHAEDAKAHETETKHTEAAVS